MTIWFTSDTHFEHAAIIKYCNRPFADVTSMNEHLVQRWNMWVKPSDIVVHTGDVGMGNYLNAEPFLSRLSGRKVLCAGNHDSKNYRRLVSSLGWFVMNELVVNDTLIRHYPLQMNECCDDWELVVHGHSHGQLIAAKHIDVGVDGSRGVFNEYGPVEASAVLRNHTLFALRLILDNLV